MPKLLFSVFFSLLLLFCSCKKTEGVLPEEAVEGILLEAVSRKPISGYPVNLTIYRQVISAEKDPEFPAGKPVLVTSHLQTITAADGRYTFRFPVHPNTAFSIAVPKTGFYLVSPVNFGVALQDDMTLARAYLRSVYDTLEAEKVGYIRYHLHHQTGFENEQLYVKTATQTPFIRPDKGIRPFPEYNILRFGFTNEVITDTVPAETKPVQPVEWLHFLTDTIAYKKDSIRVQPGSVTDYHIRY